MSNFVDDVREPLVSDMGPINSPFLSRTKRSGLRLNDLGYSYYRERVRGEVTYWRCSDKKCKGRAVQKSNIVTRTKEHTHSPSDGAYEQSDTFVGTVGPSDQMNVYETMAVMPSTSHDDGYNNPSPVQEAGVTDMEYSTPLLVWENGEEEEVLDVKPDVRELERAVQITRAEIGVNTDPDSLFAENTRLRMKIQKLEMDLRRYKDTVSRIKADIDILNMV